MRRQAHGGVQSRGSVPRAPALSDSARAVLRDGNSRTAGTVPRAQRPCRLRMLQAFNERADAGNGQWARGGARSRRYRGRTGVRRLHLGIRRNGPTSRNAHALLAHVQVRLRNDDARVLSEFVGAGARSPRGHEPERTLRRTLDVPECVGPSPAFPELFMSRVSLCRTPRCAARPMRRDGDALRGRRACTADQQLRSPMRVPHTHLRNACGG